MPSRGAAPDKRPACTAAEYALFCYLRLHPEIAKTYGIKECGVNTSIGSMLQQMLEPTRSATLPEIGGGRREMV